MDTVFNPLDYEDVLDGADFNVLFDPDMFDEIEEEPIDLIKIGQCELGCEALRSIISLKLFHHATNQAFYLRQLDNPFTDSVLTWHRVKEEAYPYILQVVLGA